MKEAFPPNHEPAGQPAPTPSKAFPANRESFGKPPARPVTPPTPTRSNPANTDPHGTRKPWLKGRS